MTVNKKMRLKQKGSVLSYMELKKTENETAMQQIESQMRSELFMHGNKPSKTSRLSQRPENKPTPAKLTISDEAEKWAFIK